MIKKKNVRCHLVMRYSQNVCIYQHKMSVQKDLRLTREYILETNNQKNKNISCYSYQVQLHCHYHSSSLRNIYHHQILNNK